MLHYSNELNNFTVCHHNCHFMLQRPFFMSKPPPQCVAKQRGFSHGKKQQLDFEREGRLFLLRNCIH